MGRLNAIARRIVPAVVAVIALTGTSPAFANSSANADIAAPVRAAQAAEPSPLGNGDDEFRQLFSRWESLDKSNGLVQSQPRRKSLIATRVSIPSRIPLSHSRTSSNFGMRDHPVVGGRRAHKGIDLAAPTGTPVYATADGLVSKAEWFSSYGLYVSLEHGADIQTRYAHMSRLNVNSGQRVQKGDIIGYVGSTGRSTGPHLHYEVRVAGRAVNPLPYMQGEKFKAELEHAAPTPSQKAPTLYIAMADEKAPVAGGK